MTRWTNGSRTVDDKQMLDIILDNDNVRGDFEEHYNASYTPIEVVHRFAGDEGYESELYDWVESEIDYDGMEALAVQAGFRPVAGKAGGNSIKFTAKRVLKPTGKKPPASKSPKLRYFQAGMKPDDMAEAIAVELTKCGLDREYGPDFDVYDDCYWYMSTGDREDFVEWADAVRPKCPKAAAMIEEAIRIFDGDGSFEAQTEMYEKLRAMSSPASSGKRTAGGKPRQSTGKGTGRAPAKPPSSKNAKPRKTAAGKGRGVRR